MATPKLVVTKTPGGKIIGAVELGAACLLGRTIHATTEEHVRKCGLCSPGSVVDRAVWVPRRPANVLVDRSLDFLLPLTVGEKTATGRPAAPRVSELHGSWTIDGDNFSNISVAEAVRAALAAGVRRVDVKTLAKAAKAVRH